MAEDSMLRGYLSVLTGDLGRLLVFAAFIPLLVRTVGQDGFGLYAIVMALFLPTRKLLNLGLFEATKTYSTRKESDERTRVITSSFALHLTTLALGIPIVGGIATVMTSGVLTRAIYLMLLAVVGEQLYFFGRGVLHAYRREALVEPLIPARSVILAVVGLVLASLGYGVPGVFAGFATGFVLTGLISTGLAFRVSGVRPTVGRLALKEYARPMVEFGVPSMALVLLITSMYKVDVLLVGYFWNSTVTGHYRAALQVSEFLWVVALGMEMMMIQSTADLWAKGHRAEISELVSEYLRYVVVTSILLVAGVFVLSEQFLTVYFGDPYVASVVPLQVLLPGVLGFAVARVIWPVLQAGGHLRLLLVATGVAVLTNLVLNLLLIPRLGIVGAAVGTSFSYGLMAVTHVIAARRLSLQPLSGVPLGRATVLGAATAGLLLVLEPIGPWYVDLTVLPLAGLFAFVIGSHVLGVIKFGELRELFRSLRTGSSMQQPIDPN